MGSSMLLQTDDNAHTDSNDLFDEVSKECNLIFQPSSYLMHEHLSKLCQAFVQLSLSEHFSLELS